MSQPVGEPRRCRQCGNTIPRTAGKAWAGDKIVDMGVWLYGSQREYEQNAHFCTLRCGYNYAQSVVQRQERERHV